MPNGRLGMEIIGSIEEMMRIVHIIPGTADLYYCQNCMRDKELVTALRARGHTVTIVPLYLPLTSGGVALVPGTVPVFYGAVTVYLSQMIPGYRHVAGFFRKWLDSRGLLERVARRTGSTRPQGLEAMTISVLEGERGAQRRELGRLVAWLRDQERPDVIHLSNALLLGLAGQLRAALKVPVVCTLQDEDSWVDEMEPALAALVWSLIADKARDIAAFLPVSHYYSDLIRQRLGHGLDTPFTVIPAGIEPSSYGQAHFEPERPVIGYLSRLCDAMGAGEVVEAFIRLRQRGRSGKARLRMTGGNAAEDLPFIEGLKRRVAEAGLQDAVEFLPSFEPDERRRFLASLALMTVPVKRAEAFGLYMVEAMASGVPVVQPRLGPAPEMIEATGAGVCYPPGDREALVQAWETILASRDRWEAMSAAGRRQAEQGYSLECVSRQLVGVYESVTKEGKTG